MRNENYIGRSFIGILIALLMNLDLLLAPINKKLTVKSVFISSIFNEATIFKQKSLVLTFAYIVVVILFLLLYGNFFRDHFENTGIYVFLRNQNRFSWYKKYTIELLFYSMLYTFTYIFSVLMLSLYHTKGTINIFLLSAGLNAWLVFTMIIYTITLIENIISIRYGIMIGELIAILILALLVQLCLSQQDYVFFQKYEILRYINPINGMKLSILPTTTKKLEIIGIYMLELGIIWNVGYFIFKKTDILNKK